MSFVTRFFTELRNAPTAQYITAAAAETQYPSAESLVVPEKVHYYLDISPTLTGDDFNARNAARARPVPLPPRPAAAPKPGILDAVVKAAGSRWALGFVLLLLVAWGVLGAVFGATDTWQVLLQDVSSLQAYASATLLMRQQNTNTRALLASICGLTSRSESNERMVESLTADQRAALRDSTHPLRADVLAALQGNQEDAFDRVANGVARAVGSLVALGVYTAAIVAWVLLGIPAGFSDTWQLWVNTGTALEITFVTMFLQNIRSQHEHHLARTIDSIDRLDREIEMQLRRMTGDMTPNPTVASEPPRLSRWVKGLDIYAFVIGGSIGIAISAVVLGLWLAVGDALDFNDNWWLIIGTYTGLIGFVDGFVLKNVDARETAMANKHFARLAAQDARVLALLGVDAPPPATMKKLSLDERISGTIGGWVESTAASWLSIFSVFALIAAASALQWTETGQLLCNTPTMIVEGFMLITLTQAHNMADEEKRITYDNVLNRRLLLDRHLAAGIDGPRDYDDKDAAAVTTFRMNGTDVEMNTI